MKTTKSYTSVKQSRKLAEILPLESADMFWLVAGNTPRIHVLTEPLSNYSYWENYPAWSLAALLDILESEINSEDGETYQLNIEKDGTWWYIAYLDRYDESNDIEIKSTEELIDACYEMILKLKELNLL